MDELSVRVQKKRGSRGVREVAKEIDISPATLSRIEGGKQPDIGTFTKLCKWLEVDPNTILGIGTTTAKVVDDTSYAHFRADKTLSSETIQQISTLIHAVQKQHQTR